MSLREGVMPHMFAVWSVAFYRCFQCNCYARRGDLSSKVTLGLLSLLVPGYLGGFQFSEMCAIRKSPPYNVSSLVRIQGIIDRLNMQIKYIFLLISVVFIVS